MENICVLDTLFKENFLCSKINKKEFIKGEMITSYIENRRQICFLKEGSADLIRTDFNGEVTTLEYYKKGDLFGELFYLITSNTQLNVIAKEDCEVLFISYNFLVNRCNRVCKRHEEIQETLLNLIFKRMIILTNHIEMLTKKSIREKLLSYFTTLSFQKSTKTFTLPLTLTALATYLNIDRSAMMREMKYLEEEGFIKKEKRKITLF